MSPMLTVRVLLADDHQVVREGLKGVLRPPRFSVVAEAADGIEALAFARRYRPDVALLDVEMPKLNGLEAARRMLAEGLPTQCVLFTYLAKESLLMEAMAAGVAGYLLKEATSDEIRERLLLAAAGEPGFSPRHYDALRERMAASRKTFLGTAPATPLSPQEEKTLHLLLQGLPNAGIAQALGLQVPTVKSHLKNIYAKLGVSGRAAAMVWAWGGVERG